MALAFARRLAYEYDDGGVVSSPTLTSLVILAALPANQSMMQAVRQRLRTGQGQRGDPFFGRKIVDHVGHGEDMRPTVVPDIPGIGDDSLSAYEDEPSTELYGGEVFDDKAKVFDLHQIFSDTNVTDKLGLSARFLQYLKRTALEKPAVAASVLESRLQKEGYPRYRIRAGRYAKGRSHASSRLVEAAQNCKVPLVSAAAEVVGDKLFMYQTDMAGLKEWTVYGPIQNAVAIRAAFRMCLAAGIYEPVFAYSLDFQILDITVVDARTNLVVSPSFVQHVAPSGIVPEGHAMPDAVSVSTADVMRTLEGNVLPVTCEGLVIGSAVRITQRYLLINEHVLNFVADADSEVMSASEFDEFIPSNKLRIAGKKFVQRNSVSKDLWVVELEAVEPVADWVFREPRIGERVLMCYSVGSSLEYTTVSRVQSYDHNMFAVSKFPQARHGTSGGVVMSVADGALLGVYNGEALYASLCSAFSPVHFGMLADLDSMSDSAAQSDMTGRLYERIESRGLRAVVGQILESLVPLYHTSTMQGVAVNFHNKLFTTVSPDEEQLYSQYGKVRFPIVFDRADRNRFVAKTNIPGMPVPAAISFTRVPELNEKVFVLSRDNEGPYLSPARRVEHVGASGNIFHVKDFGFSQLSFDGGVIVAERDGAVVGQFVSQVDTPGMNSLKRAMCYGVPVDVHASVNSSVEAFRFITGGIENKFPFLNALTWQETVVHDVFTHGSVRSTNGAMERYAAIGDTAAKLQSYKSMNAVGLVPKEWNDVWKNLHDNGRMIDLCHEMGIANLLISAPHVRISRTSKVYADLLRAFMGLVREYESNDKFVEVCKALGMLYDASTPMTQVNFPRNSRSGSPVSLVASRVGLDSEEEVANSPLALQVADLKETVEGLAREVARASVGGTVREVVRTGVGGHFSIESRSDGGRSNI